MEIHCQEKSIRLRNFFSGAEHDELGGIDEPADEAPLRMRG
jgi:hypothetical protein